MTSAALETAVSSPITFATIQASAVLPSSVTAAYTAPVTAVVSLSAGDTGAASAAEVVAPPDDCSDADLSAIGPGISCRTAVNSLGCDTDLSTVVPGQSGTIGTLCPVSCNICAAAPPPPPVSLDVAGLQFEAYECNMGNVPCRTNRGFNQQRSSSTHLDEIWDGMTPTLRIEAFDQDIWFSSNSFGSITGLSSSSAQKTIMRWRGFIRILLSGGYDFKISSDDGSLLYIDGAMLVDNDGNHGEHTSNTPTSNWIFTDGADRLLVVAGMQAMEATVNGMTVGYHSIAVLFYNNGGGGGVQASWRPTGGTYVPIGPADTRPTVPGLHLETYAFSGSGTLASYERGMLAPIWNGWTPRSIVGAFATELTFPTRADVFSSINGDDTSNSLIARFSGRVHTVAPGEYAFKLRSGDGSRLYINAQKVIDNDGFHAMQEVAGTVQLASGWQSILVVYFAGSRSGDGGLQVSVKKPGAATFESLNATETRPQRLSPSPGIGSVDICGCGTNLNTIFVAPGGASILTAKALHSICEWEDLLMQDPMLLYAAHCERSALDDRKCCSEGRM